jgi:GNAT superfamily N-acetyltransferase
MVIFAGPVEFDATSSAPAGGHGEIKDESMSEPVSFQNLLQSVDVKLDNGTHVCLRRVRHSDLDQIEKGISQMSDQSRYLRFFSGSKTLPPSVIEKLANVDGIHHLAWGVVDMSEKELTPIAAAHIFRETESDDTGEFAITVLDEYHGQGVARILMMTVFIDCYCEGLRHLRVDLLRSNKKAYGLMRAIGAKPCVLEGPVAQYDLVVADAISALREMDSPAALPDIVAAFTAD